MLTLHSFNIHLTIWFAWTRDKTQWQKQYPKAHLMRNLKCFFVRRWTGSISSSDKKAPLPSALTPTSHTGNLLMRAWITWQCDSELASVLSRDNCLIGYIWKWITIVNILREPLSEIRTLHNAGVGIPLWGVQPSWTAGTPVFIDR